LLFNPSENDFALWTERIKKADGIIFLYGNAPEQWVVNRIIYAQKFIAVSKAPQIQQ